MKNFPIQLITQTIVVLFFLSCTKVDTTFYEDKYNNKLSIFSNKGYNIMSCKIDNEPWLTEERILKGNFALGPSTYEVYIRKEGLFAVGDYANFSWPGKYAKSAIGSDNINMYIKLPQANSLLSLNQFNKKRIALDTINGFFRTLIVGSPSQTYYSKKTGIVFFETLQIDSLGPNNFRGKISGLFETSDTILKITKGRFDHEIVPEIIK